MRFSHALHGCAGGAYNLACTSDGGAHWVKAALDCGSSCFIYVNTVAYADASHGWMGGDTVLRSPDGAAHWSNVTPKTPRSGAYYGIQFTSPSTTLR